MTDTTYLLTNEVDGGAEDGAVGFGDGVRPRGE